MPDGSLSGADRGNTHTHVAENTVELRQWTTVNHRWVNVYASNERMLDLCG